VSSPFQVSGAASEPTRYAPIFSNRFFTGLWTQRNPLRDAASPYLIEKFYQGARYESLIGGLNAELTTRLTIARRPGLSVYNSQTWPAINSFYEFRQFTGNTENISVIVDTAADIYDGTGPSNKNLIFAKSVGAGPASFQSVGNILYFGDGIDEQKYLQGPGSDFIIQNWGINFGSAVVGPNLAGAGANATGTNTAWTNPNNVTNTLTSYATVTLTGSGPGHYQSSRFLYATNFGFTSGTVPPGSRITGVEITVTAGGSNGGSIQCGLVQGGSLLTGTFGTIALPASPTQVTLGGVTLGTGVTQSQVITSSFGVWILATSPTVGTSTVSVNNVNITLFLNGGPTVNASGTGLTGTYLYSYAYGNSLDGAISDSSPVTSITLSNQGAQITVNASTDPQVNQIWIFRSAANGDTLFALEANPYPNTTATYTDNSADSTLNFEIEAPGTPADGGIPVPGTNAPPPNGLINLAYHVGIVWGSVGNTVYYSNAPNTSFGNAQQQFPPLNYFIYPSLVQKLIPTALGLLVITTSDTYVIVGNGTTSPPFITYPYLTGIGIANTFAATLNGSLVYMFTTQNQAIAIDPSSGVSEVGFPIGDLLENFDPGNVYVTWHAASSQDKALYVSDGATSWYRMNQVSSPESGLSWSPLASITGGLSAVQSVETRPGLHQLLVGPATSGHILARDSTVNTDNGTDFAWNVIIGSIVLAQPGGIAEVESITTEVSATASGQANPTVGVLMDEISGVASSPSFTILTNSVTDPAILPASASVPAYRYYLGQQQTTPAWCRHMQIQFAWPAQNEHEELLTYSIYGAHWTQK